MPTSRPDTRLTLDSESLRFLIACCRAEPTEEDLEFIINFIQHPTFNIRHLMALARRHGVLPLVYKRLKRVASRKSQVASSWEERRAESEKLNAQRSTLNASSQSDDPSQYTNTPITNNKLISSLRQEYQSIAHRNILMTAELLRIMKLLEAHGIPALAFKGPALAQRAYGDITLRQYGDLDILTKKEDVYRIDALLQGEGYERLLALTPVQEKIWIRYAHDLGLVHRGKGVHLEMHWSFLDEDYPMQVDLENFWEETQTVRINGRDLPVFSDANLLYYLCIHGSKHLWERIEWIKDVDLLIRKGPVAWEEMIKKAEGSGFERMLCLGLSLSASLFRTPLPESVRREIARYPELSDLQAFVTESWQNEKSTFAKTAAILRLFPGTKEKILFLHKIIFKPSLNEYWAVDLPKGFYWGYYLVRPYLLLKKYLTG